MKKVFYRDNIPYHKEEGFTFYVLRDSKGRYVKLTWDGLINNFINYHREVLTCSRDNATVFNIEEDKLDDVAFGQYVVNQMKRKGYDFSRFSDVFMAEEFDFDD